MFAKLKQRTKTTKELFDSGPTLRNRLLFIIISAALVIVLASTVLSLRYQRQQLIKSAQTAAVVMSDAIKGNLHHTMLSDDREMLSQSVHDIVAGGAVESLRILDNQGYLRVSSLENEVGTQFTQNEALCQSCHVENAAQRANNIEVTAHNGDELLINVNLIQNQPECYGCHSPEIEILGLMMIETSLDPVNEQINMGFWRTILFALVSFVLLVGLIVPALNRYILYPIDVLSTGVAEISSGNFDHQVQIASQDELGELAGSFDHMRVQLKKSSVETARREQELSTLTEVGLAATQLLDLQEILALAMETMVDKLGIEEILIFLQDERSGRFTLQASQGISQAQIEGIERRRLAGRDITLGIVETGQEVFVPNMAEDPRFDGEIVQLLDRSYVGLPLMSRNAVVGIMSVITPVGQSLTPQDVEFLKVVGRQIGSAIDNANLLSETRLREGEAVTLYKLGVKISASLALEDVLVEVAKAARELMNADIGLVGLFNTEFQEILVKAVIGTHTSLILSKPIQVSEQSPWCELQEGRPFITDKDSLEIHNLHTNALIDQEQVHSLMIVPLRRGGQFMGMIEVITRIPRTFQARDGKLLLRLANQVVIAIENAQLYNQLHHLVVLEERDRLARELHDHLSQGLGYLKVKASITEELMALGKLDESQESLLELKRASQNLYTDVREEIFNLRTAVPERTDFFTTLQEYLANYQTHYGLNANILVEKECPSEFSPEVAGQLLRIIQEALANVRRHSDAGKVMIHCMSGGEQVCISIEDDGRGFYPAQVARDGDQHYGLQIMRERAESVGGSLELDSEPGQGTRVVVRVPSQL